MAAVGCFERWAAELRALCGAASRGRWWCCKELQETSSPAAVVARRSSPTARIGCFQVPAVRGGATFVVRPCFLGASGAAVRNYLAGDGRSSTELADGRPESGASSDENGSYMSCAALLLGAGGDAARKGNNVAARVFLTGGGRSSSELRGGTEYVHCKLEKKAACTGHFFTSSCVMRCRETEIFLKPK